MPRKIRKAVVADVERKSQFRTYCQHYGCNQQPEDIVIEGCFLFEQKDNGTDENQRDQIFADLFERCQSKAFNKTGKRFLKLISYEKYICINNTGLYFGHEL